MNKPMIDIGQMRPTKQRRSAVFFFEDMPDGTMGMTVELDGDGVIDLTSHAHRTANMIVDFLERAQTAVPEMQNEVVTPPPEKLILTPVVQAIQLVRH